MKAPRMPKRLTKLGRKSDAMRAEITVRPLVPGDRGTIETLFGVRGACAGCWCMHWRLARGGRLWREMQGEPNKRALFRLMAANGVHAAIAEVAGEPVGW